MHQTGKGKQWYFGMKLHIGADTKSGLIHSAMSTAAIVHDSQVLPDLLHGAETRVYGDSAYGDRKKRSLKLRRTPKTSPTSECRETRR